MAIYAGVWKSETTEKWVYCTGVSHMNHIKLDNIKNDFGIPNKIITDIIKKKKIY